MPDEAAFESWAVERIRELEDELRVRKQAHLEACTNLATRTFRGKDVSLGEEADEWVEITLIAARAALAADQGSGDG